jgi:membrane protein DedA with SNARE-associated domain
MTQIFKSIFRRRWLIVIGVCFLGIFLLSGQISQLFQIDFLARLNTPDLSIPAIVLLIVLSTFVSEDLTCLTAGTLVSQSKLSFPLAVFACSLGIFIGDILLFWTGRIFGRKALKIKFIAGLFSENAITRSTQLLEKYGMLAVLLSRFTPGLRLPLYLMAGVLKTSFFKFTAFFLIATILWTPIIVGVPAFFGDEILNLSPILRNNFWLGLFVIVVAFFVILKTGLKLATWKGRRLFLGKLKRIYKWEFWSLKVFYFPVAVYIAFLMLKFRRLTVFTCVNPAIFASGFVGESKAQILNSLVSESTVEFLLKFDLIKSELSLDEKLEMAQKFITLENLEFPIVVKPDIGERGAEVSIVSSFEELERKLSNSTGDLILQEYADGVETSVFYYRFPSENTGRIFSITEKVFPEVKGDGNSTLEELILKDERAICLAEKYFEINGDELFNIPKFGETLKLVKIGTHSRGAIFLDGSWMKTEALEQKIDEICRAFEGFYFGRFDIRTKSFKDFARGENFKIVELNGVTSESTNIYDPKYSLFQAYKILFGQWKIAFEIGAENVKRGEKPVSLRSLAKLVKDHLLGNSAKSAFETQTS